MNKHETIAGPSCLTNAEDDEPLFVLRANDELAPMLVRKWAEEYMYSKSPNVTPKHREKHAEALRLANEMIEWKQRKDGPSEAAYLQRRKAPHPA